MEIMIAHNHFHPGGMSFGDQRPDRRFIIEELDRGCTILSGFGGYTGKETKVIYVVLNRRDYIELRNYIKEVDNRAFLSVNEVREVLGEGYQDISVF